MGLLSSLKHAGYTIATLTISIGGFLNGFDTGSIGAVATMPQWASMMGDPSPSLIGITIAAIMLAGAVPSFFAGQLSDKYGRLAVVATGAAGQMVGCILEASAFTLPQFIVGRIVAGLGQGISLGVSNVSVLLSKNPTLLCRFGELMEGAGISARSLPPAGEGRFLP
jgi:MFS family permease